MSAHGWLRTFLADGWDVDFLGAETPESDLVELVRRRSVDLVAISVTYEECLPRLEWTVASLANLPHRPKVLVGGHVLLNRPEIAMDLGADGVGMNLSEAVLEGRRLIGIPTEPASLSNHLRVLGRRVQEIRRELGWNQQRLANAAGLDRTYISAVEHGKQNLTLGAVVKVANALGVELVRLLIQSGPHDFRAKPK